tara:strand:+ start:6720 stop:6941 length:222 start_codon:yes stop_codon:yes gene_type:complete
MGNSSSSESDRGGADTCKKDAAICSIYCVQTNSSPELGFQNELGVNKCISNNCKPEFDRCIAKSNENTSKEEK